MALVSCKGNKGTEKFHSVFAKSKVSRSDESSKIKKIQAKLFRVS